MKLASGLLFFSCIVITTYANPRIIESHEAADGKYPYVVSLRTNSEGHFCGGSIISNRWILTAAECIKTRKSDEVKVVAGTNLIHGDDGEQQLVYQAEYMVFHEGWYLLSDDNIGLIRVDKNIVFNDKVQPVKLPTEDFYKVDYSVKMIGWGLFDADKDQISNNLHEIDFKIVDQDVCRDKVDEELGLQVTSNHICLQTQLVDFCYNYSGSPVTIDDGVQIGIISFGHFCWEDIPNFITRVYKFLDWIEAKQAKFLSHS